MLQRGRPRYSQLRNYSHPVPLFQDKRGPLLLLPSGGRTDMQWPATSRFRNITALVNGRWETRSATTFIPRSCSVSPYGVCGRECRLRGRTRLACTVMADWCTQGEEKGRSKTMLTQEREPRYNEAVVISRSQAQTSPYSGARHDIHLLFLITVICVGRQSGALRCDVTRELQRPLPL